jgi:hypothetical protein
MNGIAGRRTMCSTFSRITGREENTVHVRHRTVVLSIILATLTIAAVNFSTPLPASSSLGAWIADSHLKEPLSTENSQSCNEIFWRIEE